MRPSSDLGTASSVLSPKTVNSKGKNSPICSLEFPKNLTQVSLKCYPTLTFSESYQLSAGRRVNNEASQKNEPEVLKPTAKLQEKAFGLYNK